jgi:hypothetical protein
LTQYFACSSQNESYLLGTWTYHFNNSQKRFRSGSKWTRFKHGYQLSSAAPQLLLAVVAGAGVVVAVAAVAAECQQLRAPSSPLPRARAGHGAKELRMRLLPLRLPKGQVVAAKD